MQKDFPGGSAVKSPPAAQEPQEMWSREDPLEKSMATLCSILAGKNPWTEETGGLKSIGLQRGGHNGAHKIYAETDKFFLRNWLT